jgi:Type II CAAX prenyl endopeptidase Rce1-like
MTFIQNKLINLKNLFTLDQVKKNKLSIFWSIMAIDLLVFTIFYLTRVTFQNSLDLNQTKTAATKILSQKEIVDILIPNVILIPFVEEFIFRLPITNKKYFQVFWVTALATFFGWQFGILALAISYLLIYFYNLSYKINYWVILISSLLFGLIHLTPTSISITGEIYKDLIFVGFVVLPRFLGGVLYSILRVKLGFIYSYLAHVLFNLLILLFSLNTNLKKMNVDPNFYNLYLTLIVFLIAVLPIIFILSPWFCKYQKQN